MISFSIFLVDDEGSIRKSVGFFLKKYYRISTFPAAEEALDAFETEQPDLVLLDVGLPRLSGIEALKIIKRISGTSFA